MNRVLAVRTDSNQVERGLAFEGLEHALHVVIVVQSEPPVLLALRLSMLRI